MLLAGAMLAGTIWFGRPVSLAGPAAAEPASDCILDHCEDRKPPAPPDNDPRAHAGVFSRQGNRQQPSGPSRPGAFDFWVLSLSWSPGFCATGGDEKGRDQCRAGADIGFTVHGLWPQYEHGFPSDCRGDTRLPREALALTDGLYPDRGLARYEWRRHGTCSGMDAVAYFNAVHTARDKVTIPPALRDPHAPTRMTPGAVERAFVDANPGLKPDMLAALCRRDILDEVRVCFARDLKSFRACPGVVGERCREGSLAIPPVR